MPTFQILMYITDPEFGMEKPMEKSSYGPYIDHVKNLVTCADKVKKKGPLKKPLATYNVTPVLDDATVITIVIHQNLNLDKGPYILHVKKLVTCADEVKKKGPAKKPLATYNVTPVADGTTEMNIALHQNIDLDKGLFKVSLYSITKGAKKMMFNYNIRKICSHFAFGPYFKLCLNLSDDCFWRKGSKKFKVNVTEMTMKFSGDKFFYGEFQYKSVFRCNGQMLFCFLTNLLFEKENV